MCAEAVGSTVYYRPHINKRDATGCMILRRLLIFGAITALVILTFHQLVFSGNILARGDTYSYFYPYWFARDNALSGGQLPLWTPNLFMGAPLLSNPQIGTFYPPNWFSAIFGAPPPEAIKISIVLHVILATVGMYGLARLAGKVDIIPALIAGCVFGLGGFIGAHVEQINQLQGLAWMPWAFLVYHLGFEKPLRYAPLLAMILALQFFSGHTQTVFITGVGLALYGFSTVLLDIRSVAFPAALDDWRRVLGMRVLRVTMVLIAASVLAVILALPQIIPTLELTGLSNRGGGFNPQQAMAFSWEPTLVGRGLLPSYDAQIFGEYIAYVGVFGLALALLGAFSDERRRAPFVFVAMMGIFLALGLYNPFYWQAASLPGFNLFRVPARWLGLFSLGAGVLAGMGAQALIDADKGLRWRSLFGTSVILMGLAGASLLASQADDSLVDGPASPSLLTWAAWGAAFVALANLALFRGYLKRYMVALLLLVFVVGELYFASRVMPYNDLVDRDTYDGRRFSSYQIDAYNECDAVSATEADSATQVDDTCPRGRVLSISSAFFDPGDKTALEARYDALGMSERAKRYGLTNTKLRELLAPNLPLLWDIPTIDGFDGGVLPTTYYSAFMSLLLPEGMPRTVDGRLRELLVNEACNGACVPEQRWLNLTDTRYLMTDKTADPTLDGVAYDVSLKLNLETQMLSEIRDLPQFTGDEIRVIYAGDEPPVVILNEVALALIDITEVGDEVINSERATYLARFSADAPTRPTQIALRPNDGGAEDSGGVTGETAVDSPVTTVFAATLVDNRTGDYVQLTLGDWRWALSSDIKLYENLSESAGRAFFIPVEDVQFFPDSWDGSEAALAIMRDPAFDPASAVILSSSPETPTADASSTVEASAENEADETGEESESNEAESESASDPDAAAPAISFTTYAPTRVELTVQTERPGYLLLADAYYPGWNATVNGETRPVHRADVMFRAVQVDVGENVVVFEYAPSWLRWLPLIGLVLWAACIAITAAIWNQRLEALEAPIR